MDTYTASNARPAPLIRFLGWSMLAVLLVYFLNVYLGINKEWPGAFALLSDNELDAESSKQSMIQAATYGGALIVALLYVLFSLRRPLRRDAHVISEINKYLVRGFFWAVVLIGLADATISFLRVEGLLGAVVGEDLLKSLGRSQFRGTYVHLPLLGLGMFMGLITRTLGFHWLALLIVIAELAIVFTRFIFSYEQAFMGDMVRFWYAALFLFASAHTLLEDGHVRVDVFYAGMSRRKKGAINSIGAIFLGMTLCWTILIFGFRGKASIIYGPLSNFEVSQSGFGMYTKYWMAGFLAVFAVTMLIQFVAQLFDAYADVRNEPGGRVDKTEVATDIEAEFGTDVGTENAELAR